MFFLKMAKNQNFKGFQSPNLEKKILILNSLDFILSYST
jgi:hypothetical protein